MNSLDDMLRTAFDRLAEGAAPGRSPFSMVYAATVAANGAPKVRTVVLRRFTRAPCALWFNTDLRSPKAAEIDAEPGMSILAYDRDAGFQIRLEGDARLHRDAADKAEAWAASADRSRVCYRHAYGPSSPIDEPEHGDPTDAMRKPDDPDAGFENFGAVEFTPQSIDVLDLAVTGHRRSLFLRRGGDEWRGSWLAP